MLNLRELRNFVEVAERLNITIAASVVNLSQPTLSRQIQALERKLGVILFERIGKRMVLTTEGADLATQAIALLEQADALAQNASRKKLEQSGVLRIGGTPQTITWLLSPAMARFRVKHPKVTLMLNEGNNDELIEMVEHGAVNVVVANLGINNVLVGQPLFQSQLFAILPPNHHCLNKRSISIEQIAKDTLIVMSRGFLTRHLYEQIAAAHNVRPKILLESDSTQSIAALARDGHGVGIVSSSAQNIAAMQNAVLIESDLYQTTSEVSALWNPKRYRPAYLQSFLGALADICAEHGLTLRPQE
ncbi:LysR family transcriptional regulator [Celeribacter halophilus]|uniref:LysR family transcriptional regulator n=1 Tax=Celeribacter halophilus TaxID=576117 RepID=UPI002FD0EA98